MLMTLLLVFGQLPGHSDDDRLIEPSFYFRNGVIHDVTFAEGKPLLIAAGRREGSIDLGAVRIYGLTSSRRLDDWPVPGRFFTVIDEDTRQERIPFVQPRPTYQAVAGAEGGSRVAAMTRTGLIDVYDLSDDGRLEPKYYLGGRIIDSLFSRKPRIGDQFLLSFQGSWALTASAGSRIDSWNVRSHQTRFRKRAESGIAALSPSGERIAVLVQHKAVDILDAKTGSTVASVMLGFSVDTLAVSDDGAVLAYTRQTEAEEPRPCRVDVWDVKDGKKRSELGGHGDKITSLEFCNNANMLVTGSLDRTVKLWDLKTGNARSIGPLEFETRAFPNREGTYCAVVVGPHMLDLYSITRDGTRRAWRDVWRTVSE